MLFRHDFKAMGGPAHILIGLTDNLTQRDAHRLALEAEGEVVRVERKYSRFQVGSWLGQVNLTAGEDRWHFIDAETLSLIRRAEWMFECSKGAFDLTATPFYGLWAQSREAPPSQEMLNHTARYVGWGRVLKNSSQTALRLPVGMALDFGGIGKEHAVDRAARLLESNGVQSALVNLAGDLKTIGAKPDGSPWKLGVQHPMHPDRLLATVPLVSLGMATSGGYERYRLIGGKRYSHVLDARTGWPADDWLSVTVLGADCSSSGAWATLGLLSGHALENLLSEGIGAFLAMHKSGEIVQKAYTPL